MLFDPAFATLEPFDTSTPGNPTERSCILPQDEQFGSEQLPSPLTDASHAELSIAEGQYRTAIQNHELGSDRNRPALMVQAYTLLCPDDAIREIVKLELYGKELIIARVNACAEQAFKIVSPKEFPSHANEIVENAVNDAIEMLPEPERSQVNQRMLENAAARAIAYWIRKAQPPSNTRDSVMRVSIQLPGARKDRYSDYPKHKYSWNQGQELVKRLDEEIELGPGWADDILTIDRYERMGHTRPADSELLKWVNRWTNLRIHVRQLLEDAVLEVAEAFWTNPEDPDAEIETMRSMFREIAKALLQAGILTNQVLTNELAVLVWDTAIAGGWWRLAAETRDEVFPHRLGHYWGWLEQGRDWQRLFQPEILRLRRASNLPSAPLLHGQNESNSARLLETQSTAAEPGKARTDRQLAVDAYLEEVFRVKETDHADSVLGGGGRQIPHGVRALGIVLVREKRHKRKPGRRPAL